MAADSALVSEAVVVWTGLRETTWPARAEDRLVAYFGQKAALELLPIVRALEDDFYRSDARFTAATLEEMAGTASARFRALHPEISDEAVAALAWCYTYDYK